MAVGNHDLTLGFHCDELHAAIRNSNRVSSLGTWRKTPILRADADRRWAELTNPPPVGNGPY